MKNVSGVENVTMNVRFSRLGLRVFDLFAITVGGTITHEHVAHAYVGRIAHQQFETGFIMQHATLSLESDKVCNCAILDLRGDSGCTHAPPRQRGQGVGFGSSDCVMGRIFFFIPAACITRYSLASS